MLIQTNAPPANPKNRGKPLPLRFLVYLGAVFALKIAVLVARTNAASPRTQHAANLAILFIIIGLLAWFASAGITRRLAARRNPQAPLDGADTISGPRPENPGAWAPPPANRAMPPVIKRWIFILTLFAIVMLIQPGRIALTLWSWFAPDSYAAHNLSDEEVADEVASDPALANLLLTRATSGDRYAMFQIAALYDPNCSDCATTPAIQRNWATAIYWYRRAVALDDQGAERNLGMVYQFGSGVPQDYVQAARLYERAVAKNDDLAEFYLGTMLESGQGEPANPARALALEQASAAQNDSMAQRELGRMYLNGIGTPPDRAQAEHYLRLAADQGDSQAQTLLAQNGMAPP